MKFWTFSGHFDLNINSYSSYNRSGFYATNILYEFSIIDPRIQPLVFLIRRWASEFDITKSRTTDTFTNFHLTFMALSFLQQLPQPVLPTLNELPFENGKYIFDRDRISFTITNTSTILDLFKQFLEHYIEFDESKYTLSLISRDLCPKNDPSALSLQNVYEPSESWGGNVSTGEYDTLRIMARETLAEMQNHRQSKVNDERWGLLELLTHLN